MNDYKNLIKELRKTQTVEYGGFSIKSYPNDNEKAAADAIEQLVKEYNELDKAHDEMFLELCKVKKERDAAIADIPRTCWSCKYNESKVKCENCKRLLQYYPAWEWRGVTDDN